MRGTSFHLSGNMTWEPVCYWRPWNAHPRYIESRPSFAGLGSTWPVFGNIRAHSKWLIGRGSKPQENRKTRHYSTSPAPRSQRGVVSSLPNLDLLAGIQAGEVVGGVKIMPKQPWAITDVGDITIAESSYARPERDTRNG